MPSRARHSALVLILLGMLASWSVGACGSTTLVFEADDHDIAVSAGDKFVISVESSPSVGDDWRVTQQPDPAVAEFVSDEQIMDSDAVGSSGNHLFTFKAVAAGDTEVELFNCWRCGVGDAPSPENEDQAETLSFQISVDD